MKFLVTFTPLQKFPDEPPEVLEKVQNYAFVEADSLDTIARTIAVKLNADTVTVDGVYFPDITSLPPVPEVQQ